MQNRYNDLHKWLKYHFGKATRCENIDCSKTSQKFEWSLLSGKEYEKERSNFWQLCKHCHARYDMKSTCQKGHEYTEENTRYREKGHRVCKTCQRQYMKNYGKRVIA